MLSQSVCLLKCILNLYRLIHILQERTQLRLFVKCTSNTGMHSVVYERISSTLGVMLDLFKPYSVFNGLDLQSRSQTYERARTCAIILL